MGQEYFLRELEYLLQDLTEEEREEALQYYRDLFEEAGPEKEAEILHHLGSPGRVAAELRDSLRGNADAGEYTERGYQDERFGRDYYAPDHYAKPAVNDVRQREKQRKKADKRGNGLLLLILFLVFGLPIAGSIVSAGFSIVIGLIGCVLGILGGLFALIFGGFATAAGLFISGIGLIIFGIVNLTSPAIGMMLMCFGFLMLAAAMLLLIAAKWGCTTVVPGVFRFSAELVRRVCGWCGRTIRHIFGRGGATA